MGSVFSQTTLTKQRPRTKRPVMYVDNGKRHRKNTEQAIHKDVARYLRKEYPHVYFRTDGAGMNLSKTQRGIFKSMQHGRGWPDLFIAMPSRGFYGLFIELKTENENIYYAIGDKKGQLKDDEHIQEQAAVLKALNGVGYLARFACGYDKAVALINWYFGRPESAELF